MISAQTITSELSGRVVDKSEAVIPRAAVTVIRESTGTSRHTTANEVGIFVLPALPPDTYTVRISSQGFQTFERTGIVLSANQRTSLGDIELTVGQTSEKIAVTSQGELVQTETAQSAALLSPEQLDRMVIKGRDVMNLVRLLPGVSQGAFGFGGGQSSELDAGVGTQDLGGQYGSMVPNISGARAYWNSVTLDGQVGQDAHLVSLFNAPASVDAIAEIKVVLNNYQAEYGRNSGPQINMVSKSGGREFHGSLYWFKRHEEFNANDFFNNRDGVSKPLFRFNTIGGTIGGPIYIPGKFNRNRDKLFFFYARENWDVWRPRPLVRVTVPTALERQGDFSQSLDQNGKLVAIRDPASGLPFAGNAVPRSRINPSGQAILNVFPLPNATNRGITAGNYNYQWQESQEVPKYTNLVKIDYMPTSMDTITARGHDYWVDTRGFSGIAAVNSNWPQLRHHYLFTEDSAKIGWTHVFGPSAVNEFSIGLRDVAERGGGTISPTGYAPILRSTTGVTLGQFNPAVNPNGIMPMATFGGIPSPVNIDIDWRFPINAGDQRLDLVDNFSWIRGHHSYKFGLYLERNWTSEGPRSRNFPGAFNFGRDTNNPLDSNYPFSNALLGNFASYTEPTGRIRGWGKDVLIEWFGQDTWKVTRKLTFNYGLRFSWYTPWSLREPEREGALFYPERYDPQKAPVMYRPALSPTGARLAQNPLTGVFSPAVLIGSFVAGAGNPVDGMVLARDPGVPPGFIDSRPIQVAPRIGIAYDLFGNGKTALRGGFGISKQAQLSNNTYFNRMTPAPPLVYTPQIFYGSMDTFLQAQGVIFPSAVGAFERAPVTPSVYNYSLGVQHAVGFKTVVDVSYVGNVGRHLMQNRDLNTLPYGARFQPANADPTNPQKPLPDTFFQRYTGYTNVTYVENSGTSNYNALQVSATRRFSAGVQFGLAYTWSKAMGLTDVDDQPLPMFRPYRIWNYGRLGFDQTHILVVNYLWDLPKASRLLPNPVIRHLFDNWQWNGITTFSSGTPSGIGYSTTDGADITGGGDGSRVFVVQNPLLPGDVRSFGRWFNTNAFVRPAKGDIGNAPKDVFRLPGINNWDLTFLKRIPIGANEKRYFQFRWELYNAFNHTQFQGVDSSARFDPAGNQVNARFGQVISTRLPRIMQFSLQLYF
ncbi:MAG: carboxypeptidase-like regulatory domain-containing protein [Bryobacterales bacterium]|nr:carboxypeptidase-like regulatory domain-containing protein [Bryobacterales bacterium]